MAPSPNKPADENRTQPSGIRFILALSAGLVRHGAYRRNAMFAIMLAAVLMLFAGAVWWDAPLQERPWLFIIYWLTCAALTCLGSLLAVFDLLLVRQKGRRLHRRLSNSVVHRPVPDKEK